MPTPAHLGFLDKLRLVAACVPAILLMWTIGWRAAEPTDSQLAITLTESGRSVLACWPSLLALTVVAAGIGTIIAGRRVVQGGVFAASIGLAALALRSNSMQMILAYRSSAELQARKSLMISMAWDCLLWTALLAAAWIATALVRQWLWPAQDEPSSASKTGTARPPQLTPAKSGWPALAVTAVVAALVIWLTIARTPIAQVARGQVIASVAAGLLLGAMAARYFTSILDARWYVLAVPAVAMTAYLLGYLNAGMGWTEGSGYQPFAGLATTPPHELARALPIEYLSVGTAGALAGFWSGETVQQAVVEESAS